MTESKKSWEKRLSGPPDPVTVDFVESLSLDRRLYKYDIAGSIAHAQMLADQKLITKTELKQIKNALIQISEDIAAGRFKFDKTYEDIHMAVEAALIERIGAVGEKLHTARSRNDQVATDLRLWMRDEIDLLQRKLTDLQKALLKLAEKHADDVMPAYTHLQRAQPVCVAAYLLSFIERLERDFIRLDCCSRLLNISPLGCGAVAGSTLPLDRKNTARRLGFSDISYNSIDAVSDRDFCAEFIFDCALIAAHLSQLAEDWIIYCSTEFALIEIDDRYCTSSSMMPQKRNPDLLELIRAKTGRLYGCLVGMLTVIKAQPSGYNRDLQEDKVHVFTAADTIRSSLGVAEAVVAHTRFRTAELPVNIDEGFMNATALAEYLVRKGVPFRKAHGIVGELVAHCEKHGKRLAELGLDRLKESCSAIDADVYDYLDNRKIIQNYATDGAAGPNQAGRQIAYWKKQLARL